MASRLAALGRWSLAAGWLLCAASRGRAACVPVDTTFHLVDSAAAGATPAGFVMQASGTGASGFTPAQPVTASPAYWYSPPITAVYDPGVYDLRVWTDGGAGPAEVTVQLGESNPDGSGYTALGSATQDVWAAGGNHATDFPITLPAVTLNNQVLRVTIVSAGGAQATMAFNGGTDFDSKLSTPGGVAAGCPTYTPVPCGFTTAAFTNGTTEKIDYLTPIGAAEPAGWDSNLGFNDAAWLGSVLWPGDGGHPPLAAGLSWSSYASGAASNGDDELLIRRVFNLPAGAINITGTLLLAVDDNSATTINGTAIQADAPSFVTNQVARSFPVAAGVLNPGANLLAIKVGSPLLSLVAYTYILTVQYTLPCGTATPTPTGTDTGTATPTPTASASATPTRTASPSPTPTPTPSATATPTGTVSATATPSPSSTRSATPTGTRSPTGTPSSTPTRTASHTPTGTWSPTGTPSLTATSTASPSPTASPTRSPTATSSATSSPSPSASDSPTPSATASFSASPTFSATPTASASPTHSPTPLPVSVALSVDIYNAAGEVVRRLYSGRASGIPVGVSLSGGALVAGAGGVTLWLNATLPDGAMGLAWNGANDGGQPVGGGLYYFKVQFTDPFGQVTSYIQAVQVLGGPAQRVAIFNSAGEAVWFQDLPASAQASGLSLGGPTLLAGLDPSTGGPLATVAIDLRSGGALVASLSWGGLNTQGLPVAGGDYLVELVSTQVNGGTVVQSKTLTVLNPPGQKPAAPLRAAPQPWRGAQPLQVRYQPEPGATVSATLYSLAGEAVGHANAAAGGAGTLLLPAGNLSGGLYVLTVEWRRQGEVWARQSCKVALAR